MAQTNASFSSTHYTIHVNTVDHTMRYVWVSLSRYGRIKYVYSLVEHKEVPMYSSRVCRVCYLSLLVCYLANNIHIHVVTAI